MQKQNIQVIRLQMLLCLHLLCSSLGPNSSLTLSIVVALNNLVHNQLSCHGIFPWVGCPSILSVPTLSFVDMLACLSIATLLCLKVCRRSMWEETLISFYILWKRDMSFISTDTSLFLTCLITIHKSPMTIMESSPICWANSRPCSKK